MNFSFYKLPLVYNILHNFSGTKSHLKCVVVVVEIFCCETTDPKIESQKS